MNVTLLEHDASHSTDWHKHELGQIFWLNQGLIIIETEVVQWVITPGSMGWFPPNVLHRAQFMGAVKGQCLYLNPPSCSNFPSHPGVYGADAFVIAVLERICQKRHLSTLPDYRDALIKILTSEISQLIELPLQLILPNDRRARNVANELLKNPGLMLNQEQLAHKWGLSVRNLSRLFLQETG